MTPTQAPARRLVQHIRLKAPVARVYQALTDPNELEKWFPTKASCDVRPGGAWRFEFQKPDETCVMSGQYLELVPDQLVRYSWVSPLDDDGQVLANLTVQFRLKAAGDETDLYLEETGYGEGALHDEMFGERTHGWGFFFENLTSFLAGGPDLR